MELLQLLRSGSLIFLKFSYSFHYLTISVTLVTERTIPTERPPLVGDVGANFCG
jgi:hypothetical protein